jgi:hypothetical protein
MHNQFCFGHGDFMAVSYMKGMVDSLQLNVNILERLPVDTKTGSLDEVMDWIPVGDCKIVDNLEQSIEQLLSGYALVTLTESSQVMLVNIVKIPTRSPGQAESESTIYGHKWLSLNRWIKISRFSARMLQIINSFRSL